MIIKPQQLIDFLKPLKTKKWKTVSGKPFNVEINDSSIVIIPSTKIPRPLPKNELEKFCKKFNKMQSFKPSSYNYSFFKSYLTTIVKLYFDTLIDNEPYLDSGEFENNLLLNEGGSKKIYINAYERNPTARKKCLEFYGYQCKVCNFDFEKTYGDIGKGFIHVHHKVDLSTIGKEYKVDPINDLVPVCPNCHAMLHKKKSIAYTVNELVEKMNEQKI